MGMGDAEDKSQSLLLQTHHCHRNPGQGSTPDNLPKENQPQQELPEEKPALVVTDPRVTASRIQVAFPKLKEQDGFPRDLLHGNQTGFQIS